MGFLGLGFSERGFKYWCRFLGGGVEEIWVAFVGRGCGACGRFLVEVGNLWSSMSGGVRNLELGMGWSIWGRFCGEALVALISVLW